MAWVDNQPWSNLEILEFLNETKDQKEYNSQYYRHLKCCIKNHILLKNFYKKQCNTKKPMSLCFKLFVNAEIILIVINEIVGIPYEYLRQDGLVIEQHW